MDKEIMMEDQISLGRLTATITKIWWERIIVHIDLQLTYADESLKGEKFDVYAVDQNFHAKARFKQTIVDEEHIRLSMNMTNPGNCECLPMGSYFFYVCRKQEILAKCVMAHELVPEAENVSRSFLHNNRTRGYLVNFYVTEGENDLPLLMHIMDAMKVSMEQESNGEIVKSAVTDPAIKMKKNAGRMRWKAYYHGQVKKYKDRQKVIMFMTEQSDTIGTNLQAVYDRMCERGLDKEYTILFSARPASYIRQARSSTKELLHKLAQCDMVFIDDRVAQVIIFIANLKDCSI